MWTHSIDIHNGNVILREFHEVTTDRYKCRPVRVTDAIPAAATSSHKEAPRALDSTDSALLEDILDTITNPRRVKFYRKKVGPLKVRFTAPCVRTCLGTLREDLG